MAQDISVSSAAYSLAGDVSNQPPYLQTLVLRQVLSGTKNTMGDALRNGYISGLGIKTRAFFRWVDEGGHYNYLGLPTGVVTNGNGVSPALVSPHIPVADGSADVSSAWIEDGGYQRWAEQWMLRNDPGNAGNYTASFDGNTIFVTVPSGHVHAFAPQNYVAQARYIMAYYEEVKNSEYDPIVPGSPVSLGSGDPWPSTAGYNLYSSSSNNIPVTLNKSVVTEKTYSDGRPTETTTNNTSAPSSYTAATRIYYDDDQVSGNTYSRKIRNFFEGGNVTQTTTVNSTTGPATGGGTVTTKTTTTQDVLNITRSYRDDTQTYRTGVRSTKQLFLYRIGSGNGALDNVLNIVASYGKFFPIIPVRLDNTNISASNNPTLYAQAKAATKKALGGDNYDKILEGVRTHPDVEAIDYAYLVFGVSLNTTNTGCRRYIYAFLNKLRLSSNGAYNQIRIANGAAGVNYDMRITYDSITETYAGGLSRPGARTGEVWIANGGGTMFVYWQISPDSYKYLTVNGLVHYNYIYGNDRATITSAEALSDSNESGFILPLHNGTFREMSLVHSTQLANSVAYIVFNSYVITQRQDPGFWGFLFAIFIAIVSVVFTGGAGIGLLGAHMAVGGLFGLSGMAAAIVGSIVNAVAAIVLTSVISMVATAVFGETLGPIISALVSMVIMNIAVNFHSTGNIGINFSQLFSAENLLKLTDAAVSGYQAMVRADIAGMQNQLQTLQESTEAELKRIREQFMSEFGYGGGQIDPLMFVGNSPVMAESRDTFLTRTLLTGSQIADLSLDVVNDFTSLSLTLPNAFT